MEGGPGNAGAEADHHAQNKDIRARALGFHGMPGLFAFGQELFKVLREERDRFLGGSSQSFRQTASIVGRFTLQLFGNTGVLTGNGLLGTFLGSLQPGHRASAAHADIIGDGNSQLGLRDFGQLAAQELDITKRHAHDIATAEHEAVKIVEELRQLLGWKLP